MISETDVMRHDMRIIDNNLGSNAAIILSEIRLHYFLDFLEFPR